MYKAIIFDYDDTLVLTFRNYVERDLDVCKVLSLPEPSMFQYQEAWGLPWTEIIRRVHPTVKPELFIETFQSMHSPASTQPIPGMKELLWKLHKEGYVLGILSSKPSASLKQRILFFDIQKYLAFCFGSDDTLHHKPDPRVFADVLSKLRPFYSKPSEILYVGDLVIDYNAAHGAGLSFVAVLSGPTTRSEFLFAGLPDDRIINDATELPAWLERNKPK